MTAPACPSPAATRPAPARPVGARTGRLAAALTAVALTVVPFPAGAPVADAATGGGGCAATATAAVQGVPWAQQRLQPQRAWILTRGARVAVGVVDTGVSAASPALAGGVLPGRDVKTGGRADSDCSGHGTFVAGLLAARPTAGRGFAGVAPEVRVLPIRVTADENQVDAAGLAAGIRAAVDGGARVVAVALGTTADPPAMRSAVAYAAAHDVLVVASTDTTGLSAGGPVYPAALPGVVAVDSIGSDGRPAAGGTGATPTLAAPGADLVSVAPHGDGNVTASGSGVAVAFVAGAAALVRDYRPRLTAAQVRARLESTADHPSGRLPDRLLGYGVVDPVAAVVTALPDESGGSGETAPRVPAQPIHIVPPSPADPRPARTALAVSALVVGGAALGGLTIAMVRRGRRRGWRPGAGTGT